MTKQQIIKIILSVLIAAQTALADTTTSTNRRSLMAKTAKKQSQMAAFLLFC